MPKTKPLQEWKLSEYADEGEAGGAAADGGDECGRHLGALAAEVELARVAAAEEIDYFVDWVDEEYDDVAEHRRAEKSIVVGYDVALQFVEKLADHAACKRCYEYILDRRALHAGFNTEFPSYGRYAGRVEQRLIEVEAARAGGHEVGGAGVGVEHIVEDRVVMVPFGSALEYILEPSSVERVFLQFGAVPCCSVFGQEFEYKQGRNESPGEHGGVDPHAVPVGGTPGE